MATPFAHAHVSHLVRMGRRRSRSLTITNQGAETPGQSNQRKQFLAQLKKERQKHQKNGNGESDENPKEQQTDNEDDNHTVVTKIGRAHTTMSMKKHKSSKGIISTTVKQDVPESVSVSKASGSSEEEEFHPVVTRTGRTNTMTSTTTKNTASKSALPNALQKELSTSSNGGYMQENEKHQSHITRIPRSEITTSFKKQTSTTISKTSNIDMMTTNNGLYLDFSQTSNPLQSSSTHLMSKSDVFDQEFFLNDDKDHVRRNDAKSNGSVIINGRGKKYNAHGGSLPASSSAGFMGAIIAIIIGIIAFAFGLTALILVLLLRSTVNNSLATNSTTSGSSSGSGTVPSACSAYTTLDDPTRNVNAPGYALGCDNTAPFYNRTSPIWIRFIGTGGSTLPLQTPGMNICGTEGTGWYDGDMPSSTGQIINGTACFTWYTSVCRFSSSISVANCGSFYIYLLPPVPACMARYCTI